MFTIASTIYCLAATAALAGVDPAAACRQAHADDPPAHIACLEAALRGHVHGEAPTAEAPAAAADQPEGLGSEQVVQTERARSDAPPEQVAVTIVSVTYNSQELGVFRLADGQIWRETEKTPQHQRLAPGRQYEARIERGKLGGYRMYVEGVRRMMKIERLQ